jgi:hypothetical protein
MKRIREAAAAIGLLASIAGGTLIAGQDPAAAVESSGRSFGQHVADCAQTMGFNGEHNPGMHHGYAGWDGMPCPSAA